MSDEDNFVYYNQLYREQHEIVKVQRDVEAFRRGLSAFLSLQRVTITAEVLQRNYACPPLDSALCPIVSLRFQLG